MLADQDSGRRGVFVPFMGRPASTFLGPARMVLHTGATLLMGVAVEQSETLCFAGDVQGGFIFPQLQPGFDAMFAFMKLLETTQRLETGLAGIVDQIPEFTMLHHTIECPWELKGRVMRMVAQKVEGRTETVDGLKVYTDHSWALVLPDASEPLIHLFVESATEADAQRLLTQFTELIEQVLGKG